MDHAGQLVNYEQEPIKGKRQMSEEKSIQNILMSVDRDRWSGPDRIPRGQGFDATGPHFYETYLENMDHLEIWTYTNQVSYQAGEQVEFHTSTTGQKYEIEIYRDGVVTEKVYLSSSLKGELHKTPDDFYEKGCGWPITHSWTVPENSKSGFYVVISRTKAKNGDLREQEHGFFVRPRAEDAKGKFILIAATSTWMAYNDWGGTNNYVGLSGPEKNMLSPRLSIHKPWARGFISLPNGAPRKPHDYKCDPGDIPRYPPIEFAYTKGYSKFYGCAGWAQFERHFAHWAERNGYEFDCITQFDLHHNPEILDDYKCAVIVGHDEYWSKKMRLAMDGYLEGGGKLARFAGNFLWQIRIENDGETQVCYKEYAHEADPVRDTEEKDLLTTIWEDPHLSWPGAQTVGVNGAYGVYAKVGHNAARHSGGFTIYSAQHWSLKGTDLGYGDVLGGDATIFGYEVDGLDYTMQDGLPLPTFKDGALADTQIIALGLACNAEKDHGNRGTVRFYGDDGFHAIALARYGEITDKTLDAANRGCGVIVTAKHGSGEIFCAGSCEWVNGLRVGNKETEIITRNVLDRFIG